MNNTTDVQTTINQSDSAPSAEPTLNTQVETLVDHTPTQVTEPVVVDQNDAKATATDSSTAGDTDANKKATLLDVVKAAYNGEKLDSDSSKEGEQTESAKAQNAENVEGRDGTKQSKEVAGKQEDKLPFHNHPRWKEMITEREALKPRAEQYDKIMNFMQQSSLSAEEMAEGMQVMAMMKNSPLEAYKAIKAYAERLAPYAGDVLPDDIRSKVDDGFIDSETAKELAALKAEREFMAQRNQQAQQVYAEQQVQANAKAMHDAVVSWEVSEKSRDPDWSAKYEMVMDRTKVLLQQGQPRTPSEAIEIAQRALADVNSRLRPLAGRSTSLKSPTSSLSSANTHTKPRSLEEVVRLSLIQ